MQQDLQQGIENEKLASIKKELKRGKLSLQEIAEDFEVSPEFVLKMKNEEIK